MRDTRAFLVWEEALRFVRARDLDGVAGVFTPEGVVETKRRPAWSPATHSCVEGHVMAAILLVPSTVATAQLAPALIVVRVCPSRSTATHSLVDGHEAALIAASGLSAL